MTGAQRQHPLLQDLLCSKSGSGRETGRHCGEENGCIPSVQEAQNKLINFSVEKGKRLS